ncbi:MAG: rhodanese-related sulfurtransferase [Verrucomicrobiota bacterium]
MSTESTTESAKDSVLIAAMYRFFDFPDFEEWIPRIQAVCNTGKLRGMLLMATEGLNGTIAGPEKGIRELIEFLQSEPRINGMEVKYSRSEFNPFKRDIVRIRRKKEIVTMGVPGIDPLTQAGTYVKPAEWNDLIADPDVVLIDVRNDYETALGKFEGAIAPNTEDFRHFPEWVKENLNPDKNKKVAMYCTGGIRCEKATALMRQEGFEEVYHLHGGILRYLEETPTDSTKWEGECFVFDHRVSVDHNLERGQYELRWACGHPKTIDGDGEECPICHFREDTNDDKSELKL